MSDRPKDDHSRDAPSLWDMLQAAGRWVAEHREELEAFAMWGAVMRACEETGLYAPADPAWRQVAEVARTNADKSQLEARIISLYGPSGAAHDTLREELLSEPSLADRQREVGEVLSSLAEARYYVAICGALPLVEGVFAEAYGKWQRRMGDYPMTDRLDMPNALTPDEEAEMLVNSSAVNMVQAFIPEVWRSGRMQPGSITAELNRHFILHGTARGWDTRDNAVRAVLLVAAAARVAGPLLSPR
jgi:hypothetical protein